MRVMEKIIVIVGLTSSGKSSLAIELAKFFKGEIVSADSRQVYRGLDYLSGKVSKEEMNMVPHHLIDVANLGDQFSLYDFQNLAYHAIDDILKRGKLPFLVGGTGLYTRAIVQGYVLSNEKPNENLRQKLEKLSLDELKKICIEKNISIEGEQTCRRLIRLIETNGEKSESKPRYDVLQIGIRWDREKIYERIKARLFNRMPYMLKEMKGLLESGVSRDFLLTLGLEAKNVLLYLEGGFDSFEDFFEELFKQERHFAKRQQTWYNKEKNIVWLDADENLFENSKKIIEKFLNLDN